MFLVASRLPVDLIAAIPARVLASRNATQLCASLATSDARLAPAANSPPFAPADGEKRRQRGTSPSSARMPQRSARSRRSEHSGELERCLDREAITLVQRVGELAPSATHRAAHWRQHEQSGWIRTTITERRREAPPRSRASPAAWPSTAGWIRTTPAKHAWPQSHSRLLW